MRSPLNSMKQLFLALGEHLSFFKIVLSSAITEKFEGKEITNINSDISYVFNTNVLFDFKSIEDNCKLINSCNISVMYPV